MPFRIVPARDRKLFRALRRGRRETVARGSELFRRGLPATDVLVVWQGHVRLTHSGSRGRRERTVALVGPDEICGLEAMAPEGTYLYDAAAAERSDVQRLAGGRFRQAVEGTRWTFGMLMSALNHDLAAARSLVGGPASHTASARLARVFRDLADRFGESGPDGTELPRRFTHQELADLSGSHRSTVTTLLNEWLYQGWLREGKGTWVVCDPEPLERVIRDEQPFGR